MRKCSLLAALFCTAVLGATGPTGPDCDEVLGALWNPVIREAAFLGMNYSNATQLALSEHQKRDFYELARVSHFLRKAPESFYKSLTDAINRQGKANQPLDRELAVREALEKNGLKLADDLVDYLVSDLPASRWKKPVPITRIDEAKVKAAMDALSDEEVDAMARDTYANGGNSRASLKQLRNRSYLARYVATNLKLLLSRYPSGAMPRQLIASYPREAVNEGDEAAKKVVSNALGVGPSNDATTAEVYRRLRKRLIGRADALRLVAAADRHRAARQEVPPRVETRSSVPPKSPAPKKSKKERKAEEAREYELRKAAGLANTSNRPAEVRDVVEKEPIEPVAPVVHFKPWSRPQLVENLSKHSLSEDHFKTLLAFFDATDFAAEKRSALRLLQRTLESDSPYALGHASVQPLAGMEISELRPSSGYSPIRIYFGMKSGHMYFVAAANKRREAEFERIRDYANRDWIRLSEKLPGPSD